VDFKRIFRNRKYFVLAVVMPIALIIGSFLSMEIRLLSLFLFFIIICGAFSYFQATFRMPIDFSPTFFFSIIISIQYGIFYPLLFIPFAGILPSILAGGELGIGAFMFMGSFIIAGIAAKLLIGSVGLVAAGIIAAAINLTLGWFINSIQGNPGGFFFSVINALMTAFYLITFGAMIVSFIG
jgi:hypothetical protein